MDGTTINKVMAIGVLSNMDAKPSSRDISIEVDLPVRSNGVTTFDNFRVIASSKCACAIKSLWTSGKIRLGDRLWVEGALRRGSDGQIEIQAAMILRL